MPDELGVGGRATRPRPPEGPLRLKGCFSLGLPLQILYGVDRDFPVGGSAPSQEELTHGMVLFGCAKFAERSL